MTSCAFAYFISEDAVEWFKIDDDKVTRLGPQLVLDSASPVKRKGAKRKVSLSEDGANKENEEMAVDGASSPSPPIEVYK